MQKLAELWEGQKAQLKVSTTAPSFRCEAKSKTSIITILKETADE